MKDDAKKLGARNLEVGRENGSIVGESSKLFRHEVLQDGNIEVGCEHDSMGNLQLAAHSSAKKRFAAAETASRTNCGEAVERLQ